MPHTRHPATEISQSVEAERAPPPPPATAASPPAAWPAIRSSHIRNIHLIKGNNIHNFKKRAFDEYIFATYAPEFIDGYWLWGVLLRAPCCCLIRRSVFWCQGLDSGGRCISSDTVERNTSPATMVISSHHNDISARPFTPKWISNG